VAWSPEIPHRRPEKKTRAEQGLDVDVDNLYVKQALANDGPRMKRIRPAPRDAPSATSVACRTS
jgi:ribosomal protein L22